MQTIFEPQGYAFKKIAGVNASIAIVYSLYEHIKGKRQAYYVCLDAYPSISFNAIMNIVDHVSWTYISDEILGYADLNPVLSLTEFTDLIRVYRIAVYLESALELADVLSTDFVPSISGTIGALELKGVDSKQFKSRIEYLVSQGQMDRIVYSEIMKAWRLYTA